MIHIKQHLVNLILKEAKTTYPHECCGMLVGINNEPEKVVHAVYPVENKNKVRAADRYEIDSKEFDRIDREAMGKGWNIIGIYHSHPDHPAEPSAFDKECANVWTEYSYVIVSVKNGKEEDMKCWSFNPGTRDVEEEEIKVNRRDFTIGMLLIAFSFIVYFCLYFIPLFPVSKKTMAGSAAICYLFSWGLTGIGIYFTGKEGYEYIKQEILKGFFRKFIGRKRNE